MLFSGTVHVFVRPVEQRVILFSGSTLLFFLLFHYFVIYCYYYFVWGSCSAAHLPLGPPIPSLVDRCVRLLLSLPPRSVPHIGRSHALPVAHPRRLCVWQAGPSWTDEVEGGGSHLFPHPTHTYNTQYHTYTPHTSLTVYQSLSSGI